MTKLQFVERMKHIAKELEQQQVIQTGVRGGKYFYLKRPPEAVCNVSIAPSTTDAFKVIDRVYIGSTKVPMMQLGYLVE